MKQDLDLLGYDDTSLLSFMTLECRNVRDFGSTAKEAYYYISRGSWYPVPQRSLGLFEIPSIPLPSAIKAT